MNAYSGSYEDKTAIGEGTVVLKFHATWCGPCKKIAPSLIKLAEAKSKSNGITFFEVDIDDHPQITEKYEIEAVPTVIKLVNGKIMHKWVGGECIVADIESTLNI
jgi:thioredoxin 1